ncbi:MAG: hypothetical protein HQM12_18755 [SAR324 cluster bacterium]|nr:hypothetical protein [SAR324 cluster bacterium]
MSLQNYQPYWPETVIFWGAGATTSLGMPNTAMQGTLFSELVRDKVLDERIHSAFSPYYETAQEPALVELFAYLEAEEPESLPTNSRKRFRELRNIYDWRTLRKIIQVTPKDKDGKIKINDLFNLIDMHRSSHHGFPDREGNPIAPDALERARHALIMILSLMFHGAYRKQLKNPGELQKYYQFAEVLAQMMMDEGMSRYQEVRNAADRRFCFFSYAVISMNWDPMLLWMLFNAHGAANKHPSYIELDRTPIPMKLFHDLGHFMGIRKIDGKTPEVWYPMSEASAQRLNDPEHFSGRRVRLGKFYFPHGCLNGRECPNCGKWVVDLGEEWNAFSQTLFPAPILKSLEGLMRTPRSDQEKEAFDADQSDAVQCSYCGTLTEQHHVQLLMQTHFKHNTPPFLEEIQRDMRVALENANHLVFMGFSLPEDDVIYRSLLAARQSRDKDKKICISIVVGRESNAPDQWLSTAELHDYFQQNPKASAQKVFESIQSIFGDVKIRGYLKGIPSVFLSHENADRQKIETLIRPW